MDGVKRNHPSGFRLVLTLVFVLAGLSPAAVAQQVQTLLFKDLLGLRAYKVQ